LITFRYYPTRKRKDENENQKIGNMTRRIKNLALDLNCPVLLLSQLTRAAEGQEPRLEHLRESGCIEQDADKVLMLHKAERSERETEIIVRKDRVGAIDYKIQLCFNPNTTDFREIEADYRQFATQGRLVDDVLEVFNDTV